MSNEYSVWIYRCKPNCPITGGMVMFAVPTNCTKNLDMLQLGAKLAKCCGCNYAKIDNSITEIGILSSLKINNIPKNKRKIIYTTEVDEVVILHYENGEY